MNIAFDAKRAFHNTRGLGNYSRDLIRILQEHKVGRLFLFQPQTCQNAAPYPLCPNYRDYPTIFLLEKTQKPVA